jgi:hypothetical protein
VERCARGDVQVGIPENYQSEKNFNAKILSNVDSRKILKINDLNW